MGDDVLEFPNRSVINVRLADFVQDVFKCLVVGNELLFAVLIVNTDTELDVFWMRSDELVS